MSTQERAAQAGALFDRGYNCAQSVLIPKWEEMGLDHDMAKRLSKNFGVGMKIGSTCGAITGGLMVLGLKVVHEFSFGRTVLAVLYSLIGILIILFLALLLWSLFQQLAMFLVSLYDELSLKLK